MNHYDDAEPADPDRAQQPRVRLDVVRNGSAVIDAIVGAEGRDAGDVLAAIEQAEADAEAAEANAAAARSRAAALRLRSHLETVSGEAVAKRDSSALPQSEGQPDGPSEPAGRSVDDVGPPRWYRRKPRIGRSQVVCSLAALIGIGAAAATGVLYWQHMQTSRTAEQAAEFEASAVDMVLALTSLDFANATDDVQRVLSIAGGPFKEDFQQRSEDFRKIVEESKVVSEGHVFATAVETMNDDAAVVLVAATSEITGPPDAKEPPRAWRLAVEVTRESGMLKVTKVDFVQ